MNACHHIAFNCVDRKQQERFYVRHFGFTRSRVFHPEKPNEFVLLRLGNMRIELFSAQPEHLKEKGSEQPIGFRHLAFTVPNLEAKIKELQAAGTQPDDIIDCDHMAKGLRICFFKDPEGNMIELMEGWTEEENPPPLDP